MSISRRSQLRVLGGLAVVAISVGACSSSGKSSSASKAGGASSGGGGTPASQGSAAASLTGTPVKIGLAAAMTGAVGVLYQDSPTIVKVWEQYVNAHGGIAGHPVQVIVEDTKSTPSTALSVAHKLIETDHVVAMIDADDISLSAMDKYVSGTGVPLLGYIDAAPGEAGVLPNAFPATTDISAEIPGFGVTAKANGAKVESVVYCAEAPGCAAVTAGVRASDKVLGVKFGIGAAVAFAAPSFTSQCVQIVNAKSEHVDMEINVIPAVRLVQTCLQQGYHGTFGINNVAFKASALSKLPKGTKFRGLLEGFPWWASAAPVQAMRDAFSKYASGFDYREGWTTAFWATGELFRKALSSTPAATSIDAATVVAAYNKVQNETLDGLLAQPVTFSNGKAKPVQCFWLYKYDIGDKDASSVAPVGASGNGQSGDLASSCFPPK